MKCISFLNNGLMQDYAALNGKKVNARNIQLRLQVADKAIKAAALHAGHHKFARHMPKIDLLDSTYPAEKRPMTEAQKAALEKAKAVKAASTLA